MHSLALLVVFTTILVQNLPCVSGTIGVDVSSLVSQSGFSCLKNNGIEFVIVRAYQSVGHADPNAKTTIAHAKAAGIAAVDVYLFPCPRCSISASQQVTDMVKALAGTDYGQIWLDIEGSQYWLSSHSENQRFFNELLQAAASHKTTGVYASQSQWTSIMGNYTGGAGHQLWYAHYDNNPSFSDFSPFGGWKRPAIKQYVGDKTLCGVGVDKDFY